MTNEIIATIEREETIFNIPHFSAYQKVVKQSANYVKKFDHEREPEIPNEDIEKIVNSTSISSDLESSIEQSKNQLDSVAKSKVSKEFSTDVALLTSYKAVLSKASDDVSEQIQELEYKLSTVQQFISSKFDQLVPEDTPKSLKFLLALYISALVTLFGLESYSIAQYLIASEEVPVIENDNLMVLAMPITFMLVGTCLGFFQSASWIDTKKQKYYQIALMGFYLLSLISYVFVTKDAFSASTGTMSFSNVSTESPWPALLSLGQLLAVSCTVTLLSMQIRRVYKEIRKHTLIINPIYKTLSKELGDANTIFAQIDSCLEHVIQLLNLVEHKAEAFFVMCTVEFNTLLETKKTSALQAKLTQFQSYETEQRNALGL